MTTLHFKTHAHIKNVLGQELINDDNVAVQELVKNSFDAGSESVKIIFKNLKHNKDDELDKENREKLIGRASKLLIIDEGAGMSVHDIENKWLNIAYSAKKFEKKVGGRRMAGNKGVGRFSCDRLGEFLDLYTKTKDDDKIAHLIINWGEFEAKTKINDVIQDVNVYLGDPIAPKDLEKNIGYTIESSGTILEISRLREPWIDKTGKQYSYEKIVSLKKNLEKLTNPNQQIEKEGFQILLTVEDLSKEDFNLGTDTGKTDYEKLKSEVVENQIFKNLSFKTTYIESSLTKDRIKTALKYRGEVIFELVEKNRFTALRDVSIKIKLHFLNQYSKAYFKRYTGVDSVNYGSIFVFINGFRITPYGDQGNDWITLETRKGQGRARFLGTRDLVGWFEIDDDKNVFRIISNREGIVRDEPYRQLVGHKRDDFTDSYFYSVFRKLELFVVDGLDWDRIRSKDTVDEEEESAEISAFMKEIQSKAWTYDPSREKYATSLHDKNIKMLQEMHKIILAGTNKKDIISIYINEEVIGDLANENAELVKSIIEKLDGFKDLDVAKKTAKGISSIRKLIEEVEKKHKEAEKRATTAERRAEKAETGRKEAQQRAEKAEKAQKKAETENIFLKSTSLQDKDQLISLFHYIGIHSDTIKTNSTRLLKTLAEVKDIPDASLKQVEGIAKLAQMINTISKIGYKGGITEEMEREKQDIVQFAYEFVENICRKYYSNIEIKTENNVKRKYIREFSPFEMTYVIDNFISNSKKADATKMLFKFSEDKEGAFIEVSDNGRGLDPRIKEINEIFDRTVTTTRGGAGLGLYDARKILSKAKMKLAAESLEKGFKLVIRVPREN